MTTATARVNSQRKKSQSALMGNLIKSIGASVIPGSVVGILIATVFHLDINSWSLAFLSTIMFATTSLMAKEARALWGSWSAAFAIVLVPSYTISSLYTGAHALP